MLTVLFFGQIRERLNTDKISVNIDELSANTVAALRAKLKSKDDLWCELLVANQCLVAVNQTMANDHTLLSALDEIAFFPPVTGG